MIPPSGAKQRRVYVFLLPDAAVEMLFDRRRRGAVAAPSGLRQQARGLPIPGASKLDHLEGNVVAAGIVLDDDFKALDSQARTAS